MATTGIELIRPDWPAPAHVHAAGTTRFGGYSHGRYDSFNLGAHVDDDPRRVERNRCALRRELGIETEPLWLDQVHGTRIVVADSVSSAVAGPIAADASITAVSQTVCAVLTADCLPVLFSDREGRHVAAAHAGWRGLVAGVLENTVATFALRAIPADQLIAWLGPAIGPAAYEVDAVVANTLGDGDQAALTRTNAQHWQLDLAMLARLRLAACGVAAVFGGDFCTFAEPERFFSYRRDGVCGRQAALIWRE